MIRIFFSAGVVLSLVAFVSTGRWLEHHGGVQSSNL